MDLFKIVGKIAVENDEANKAIDETTDHADNASNSMSGAFKKIGAAVATYLAVDKIIDFGKAIVDATATVSAEQSAFEQIMGDYAQTARDKMGQIADQTGVVDSRLTSYMTSMTAKFSGLGYGIEEATDLASDGLLLALDAAAFWDKSLEDSMSALNSFINGSYEGGEAIGLFANDTQMAAYAVEQGIVSETKEWANLDEARKQATRLEYAKNMQQMSGVTGQASKEADQYANVQANLTEKWRQFKAEIGEPILQNFVLPAMQKASDLVDVMSKAYQDATKWISENGDKLVEWGGYLTMAVAGITAFTIAMKWSAIIGSATTAIKAVTSAVALFNATLMANPIGLVIGLIAALVAGFIYFWNTSEEFRQFWIDLWAQIQDAFGKFVDWMGKSIDSMVKWFSEMIDSITEWWTNFTTELSTAWTNVWNSITSFLQDAWETIKAVVQVGIMFIGNLINFAIDLLLIPWRFIWENFGSYLTAAWEKIKTIVKAGLNAVVSFIQKIWGSISTTVSKIWDAVWNYISTVMTNIWTTISTWWMTIWTTISTWLNSIWLTITEIWTNIWMTISTWLESIWTTISTMWTNIWTTITTVMNNIKTTITNVWNTIKTTVSTVVTNIKTTISNTFNQAWTTVKEIFGGIYDTISEKIGAARDFVKGAIDKMKSFFNFEWSLPHLKLPHISITGSFSLFPPSAPSFSIEWYKKGGILTDPTMFGFNPFSGKAMVGGEAGDEAIAPIDTLLGYVREAVNEENAALNSSLNRLYDLLAEFIPQIANKDMQLVLDSGALVGQIAPQMDDELGDIYANRGRGR